VTPKHAQSQSDLTSVVSLLSGVDNSIQSQSIKDVYRLGRFNSDPERPRPILVKFVRAADASSVLSKKGSLSRPLVIKPDLSPEERLRDSVLLKERWNLIQSGIPRGDIKICDSRLYVRKKLYGHFDKSKFQYSSSPSQPLPTSTNHSHWQSDVPTPTDNAPLSHNTQPIVPPNSVAESKSPTEASLSVLSTNPTPLSAQCSTGNSLTQPQSPSYSLPPPESVNDSA